MTIHDEENRAGWSVLWHHRNEGEVVGTVPLDQIIEEITSSGKRRIAFLKIDCEGAEFPILLTSRCLRLVDRICGEYHEYLDRIPAHAYIPGYERFTMDALASALHQNGFGVHTERYDESTLGMFFATSSGEHYLMEQLSFLRRHYELRPAAVGPLARLRARLAWWLLAPEIRQINETHAATVRILNSLVARLERQSTERHVK
jgi:hypothetical protein